MKLSEKAQRECIIYLLSYTSAYFLVYKLLWSIPYIHFIGYKPLTAMFLLILYTPLVFYFINIGYKFYHAIYSFSMVDINIKKFTKWLEARGVEILPVTNEYELLRFKGKQVGVIYKTGNTSGEFAHNALKAFKNNSKWDGAPISTGRHKSYSKEKKAILLRDGTKCFYCGEELGEDITIEHLIPLASGGSNSLSNMVLAHECCNQYVNTMPIYQKMEVAVSTRIAMLGQPGIPVSLLFAEPIPKEQLSISGAKIGRFSGKRLNESNKPKDK